MRDQAPIPGTGGLNRRRRQRLKLVYRVRLQRAADGVDIRTTTEDVSGDGFFCCCDRPFAPGDRLDCELIVDSGAHNLILHCHGEVVRVEVRGLSPGFGVAVRFQSYRARLDEGQVRIGHHLA